MSKSPQHQDMGKQMLQTAYNDKAEYSQCGLEGAGLVQEAGSETPQGRLRGRALWERSCCNPLDLMLYL